MPELNQARLLAQLQNLLEQIAKRLQVPLAEIRDGPEIRGIERHNGSPAGSGESCAVVGSPVTVPATASLARPVGPRPSQTALTATSFAPLTRLLIKSLILQ
jgi:hypothetical protein